MRCVQVRNFVLFKFVVGKHQRATHRYDMRPLIIVIAAISVAVIVGAFPVSPQVVDCAASNESNPLIINVSSNSWFLLNCTILPTATTSPLSDVLPSMPLATFVRVSSVLENVRIDAEGTNVFPQLLFADNKANSDSLSNITVRLYNITTGMSSPGQQQRVMVRGSAYRNMFDLYASVDISNVAVIIDRCSIEMNVTMMFVSIFASSVSHRIANVSFHVLRSNISVLTFQSQQGVVFLLNTGATAFGSGFNGIARGVDIRVEDSQLAVVMLVGNYHQGVISVSTTSQLGIFDTAIHVARSNLSMRFFCTTFNDVYDCFPKVIGSDPTAYGAIILFRSMNVSNMILSVDTVTTQLAIPVWNASARVSVRLSLAFFLSATQSDCITGLTVDVRQADATIRARQGSALMFIVGYDTLALSSVSFQGLSYTGYALGAIRTLDGARVNAVMVLEPRSHKNVTYSVDLTTATLHLTSGEATPGLAYTSNVVLVSAALLLITSVGTGMNISIHRSTAHIYQLDGYASSTGQPIVFLAVVSSLVNIALPSAASSSTNSNNETANIDTAITIKDSSLSCHVNSSIPTLAFVLTAVVNAISALVVVSTSLVNATVIAIDSNVTIMSTSCIVPVALQQLIGTTASFTNITAILSFTDAKSLTKNVVPSELAKASLAMNAYLSVPLGLHRDVRISVIGGGIFLATTHASAATPVTQSSIDRAVFAIVLTPASMTLCTVRTLLGPLLMPAAAASTAGQAVVAVHPTAFVGIADVNITSTHIVVSNTNVGADVGGGMDQSSLMSCIESRWGVMRLNNGTSVNIGSGAMRGSPPLNVSRQGSPLRTAPIVGFDVINDNRPRVVVSAGVIINISDAWFNGFDSIVGVSTEVPSDASESRSTPRLSLGCSMWNGTTMQLADVGSAMPTSLVAVTQDARYGPDPAVRCRWGITTPTATIPPPEPVPPLHISTYKPQSLAGIIIFGAFAVSQGGASAGGGGPPATLGAFALTRLRQLCQQQQQQASSVVDGSSNSNAEPLSCDPMDNPLQLTRFSSVPAALQCAVGTIIGNVVMTLVIAAAAHLGKRYGVPYVRSLAEASRTSTINVLDKTPRCTNHRLGATSSTWMFHWIRGMLLFFCTEFPGSMALPYSILGVPTVAASVMLVGHADATSGTVALGVFGFSLCIAFPVLVVWQVLLRVRPFPLSSVLLSRRGASNVSTIEWLTQPVDTWRAPKALFAYQGRLHRSSSDDRSVHLKNCRPFFEGFRGRRHWFFCIDFSLSMVTGLLIGSAYALAGDASACDTLVWAGCCVAVAAALELMLCCVLRPFSTPIDLIASAVVALLAVLSEVVSLADDSDAGGEAASSLALAGAVAQFVPTLLTTVYAWEWKFQRAVEAMDFPCLHSERTASLSEKGSNLRCGSRLPSLSRRSSSVSPASLNLSLSQHHRRHTDDKVFDDNGALASLIRMICVSHSTRWSTDEAF